MEVHREKKHSLKNKYIFSIIVIEPDSAPFSFAFILLLLLLVWDVFAVQVRVKCKHCNTVNMYFVLVPTARWTIPLYSTRANVKGSIEKSELRTNMWLYYGVSILVNCKH